MSFLFRNKFRSLIMSFGLDAYLSRSMIMTRSSKAYETCSKRYRTMMKLTPLRFRLLVRRTMMVSFMLSKNDNLVPLCCNSIRYKSRFFFHYLTIVERESTDGIRADAFEERSLDLSLHKVMSMPVGTMS